ncbi:MAG TPA: trehalase family glycosidase [Candidatus Sulfotelmatobacter sp.]|jgi:neutral trehalase|nr:trehalase family glycosidase [Candidatus Sulfotelmatobacter sp.]
MLGENKISVPVRLEKLVKYLTKTRQPETTPVNENLSDIGQQHTPPILIHGKAPFRLAYENQIVGPILNERRAPYFDEVQGERQINLAHENIIRARKYCNEILDGKKVQNDGSLYGLRVRARERNQQSPEMLEMGGMSLPELVAYTKDHESVHKKLGTNELLLPHDYPKATAGEEQWGEALFYHDAPLLVEGILASDIPDKIEYAKGTLECLINELYTFHFIPTGSSLQLISRSHPPSLTRMGLRICEAMVESKKYSKEEAHSWLGDVMEAAEYEFTNYWKNEEKYNHFVPGSTLITPGDIDVGAHDPSERETGHDMTPEYHGRANDFLDPNINGELVGYAWDIALYKRLVDEHEAADKWQEIGDTMAEEMRTMFDGEIYRAVDIRNTKEKSTVASLTGYKPMANGIPPTDHTDPMVRQLYKFTGPYGVAHIVPETVPQTPQNGEFSTFSRPTQATLMDHFRDRQWGGEVSKAQKNATEWPIDIYALIKGLRRYGYYDLATETAENWLLSSTEYLNNNGTLPEKRNVITGENGHGVEYSEQVDFGWSIALYLWLLQELPDLYALRKKGGKNATFPSQEDVFVAYDRTSSTE